MKKLKVTSIIALILCTISMMWGIGVVCYYVDDLFIRGISIGILIASSTFVSSTVGLIFKHSK